MNINAIEELERVLDEIDAKIKHLESSPNRAFVLVEYETVNLFHWFNKCFKQFWDEFDHSACQLLLFLKFTKRHSELNERYVALFREQIEYLKEVIDFDDNCVKDLPPVIFAENYRTDVLGYYMERLKDETDEDGSPFYDIELDSDTNYEMVNGKEMPIDFYIFRSDKINDKHYTGLIGMYNCLSNIYHLMSVVCSYPQYLQLGYTPSVGEIIYNLESELCCYAREIGQSVFRELKKIFLEFKRSNNESLPTDVWGKVMELEDDAFRLAISEQLIENEEKRFEYIDEDQRKLWTENYALLQKIKDTCIDDELFDVKQAVETHNLLSVLNAKNLDLFYELVLRRNIIHREMYSETLRVAYDEWVNPKVEIQTEENEDTVLSAARQSKLDEIIGILQNGNWKTPATAEKITQLLNVVFGKEEKLLDEGDMDECEKMWALVESGSGANRQEIVSGNLAGFLRNENLIVGSPSEICNDIYGKCNNQLKNYINKGNPNNCSQAFGAIIPFLRKYVDKIIRKD